MKEIENHASLPFASIILQVFCVKFWEPENLKQLNQSGHAAKETGEMHKYFGVKRQQKEPLVRSKYRCIWEKVDFEKS
jgi:hypothetical protein